MKTGMLLAALVVALTTAVGCSQEQREEAQQDAKTATQGLEDAARDSVEAAAVEVAESAQAAADDLDTRVENSAEIAEDTYEELREKGEGTVDAAGGAYNAVLEAGKTAPDKDTAPQ